MGGELEPQRVTLGTHGLRNSWSRAINMSPIVPSEHVCLTPALAQSQRMFHSSARGRASPAKAADTAGAGLHNLWLQHTSSWPNRVDRRSRSIYNQRWRLRDGFSISQGSS